MISATVMVIDDEPDVRAAISLLLKSMGYRIKTYETAQDYWAEFDINQTGCLVLDVRMPGMSGMELQTKLKQLPYHPPIIMISGHGEIPMAVKAVQSGAIDFLQKPFSDQILLDRVQQALKLDLNNRAAITELRQTKDRYSALTNREREVLYGVAKGKLNKIIAADLCVSTRTIEIHRANMMEKMGVKSLSSLMRCVTLLEENNIIKNMDPITDNIV